MFLGKNWDDVTKELIRRAIEGGHLPDKAEFTIRQFLEDGLVVVAYQKSTSNRSSRGGTTTFFELRVREEGIAISPLSNLGPVTPAVV